MNSTVNCTSNLTYLPSPVYKLWAISASQLYGFTRYVCSWKDLLLTPWNEDDCDYIIDLTTAALVLELTTIRSALEWFVLPFPAQHKWDQPSRARLRPAPRVWVVNFYSTTKTKQCTTINPATIMTMSHHAEKPWLTTPLWWKRPQIQCQNNRSVWRHNI